MQERSLEMLGITDALFSSDVGCPPSSLPFFFSPSDAEWGTQWLELHQISYILRQRLRKS